jgi:hypothetical protein
MKKLLRFLVIAVACPACVGVRHAEVSLPSGNYQLREGDSVTQVYAKTESDSVSVYLLVPNSVPSAWRSTQTLTAQAFDIDVLTIPFKFRPSAKGLPRQLTTDFTGNLFLGYRADRYKPNRKPTPAGFERGVKHRAYTIGAFGGIGTSSISPWTTNNRTQDEYNGFILSHGLSGMVGISNLTVGVAVGWDYLTDRDRAIWIYQNRPWVGLALSLNLN